MLALNVFVAALYAPPIASVGRPSRAAPPIAGVGLPPRTAPPQLAVPRHVALIPDGNSRWARQHGVHRRIGHTEGASAMRRVVEAAASIEGVDTLTVFALSTENLARDEGEVAWLLDLVASHCSTGLVEEGVRVRFIGDLSLLPPATRATLEAAAARRPARERLLLCVAVGYGGQREVASVARTLAESVAAGELRPEELDEECFARALRGVGAPTDPELLIRTGGERRLSNFLLFQLAYTELVHLEMLWPDFGERELRGALDAFAARTRNFGRARTS